MKTKITLASLMVLILTFQNILPVAAQTRAEVFDKIEMLVPNGEKINEKSVLLTFTDDSLQIETTADKRISKVFKYADIRDAEYSYSKNPRWKTGLGLGAASILFPPLLLVALPLGFSKHRRHWLTIRTENDFVVLKLSKKNRKLILPTLETRAGVDVQAKGEDK